ADLPNDGDGFAVESPRITVHASNPIRFPDWHDRTELAISVNLQAPETSPNYIIHFFTSDYPKSYSPFIPRIYRDQQRGSMTAGNLDYSEPPENRDFGDGRVYPTLFS